MNIEAISVHLAGGVNVVVSAVRSSLCDAVPVLDGAIVLVIFASKSRYG